MSEIDPHNKLFKLQPVPNTLHTVNGEVLSVAGSVDIILKLGDQHYDVNFMVCEMNTEAILGQDFLKRHVDSINYRKSCLQLGNNIVPLYTGGKSLQICRVEMKETIKIPAQSRMWVPVKVPQSEHLSENGFVEPIASFMAKNEVLVMSGIIDTKQDPVVNVINYGNTPTTLHKNTNIGSCESYTETETMVSDRVAHTYETDSQPTVPEHLKDLYERSSVHLNDNEKHGLVKLLYKYRNTFSKSSEDIGITSLVQHSINTKDAVPVRQPPRRLPLGKRAIEKEEINKMLTRGIIEPSNSAWASPVVLVTKKDGTPRFCIDYRKLNDLTVKDAYPLPRVDDCIDALSGARFFSSLDLNSGYWQVAMNPADKEKTAFATTMGLFHFTVMSFGLANAPSTFERLMENVLRGLQWEECLLYMDDIISPCETILQGLEKLDHIFSRLQQANLKLKPSKCVLFQKKVNFLGHVVSEEGIATDPNKISAIEKWPTPRNAKEVRSFLGLCSYYRRFVEGFANLARPLYRLTDKGKKFEWLPDCENAFKTLKNALISAPILGYPVPNDKFVLDTDASDDATGAVLSQVQNGREVVIAYLGKSLNIHEQNYSVTRKELLAEVNALKSFHHFIYGQPVLLRTDNAAVCGCATHWSSCSMVRNIRNLQYYC